MDFNDLATLIDLRHDGVIRIYAYPENGAYCAVEVLENSIGITQEDFRHSERSLKILWKGHLASTKEIIEAYNDGGFAN